MLIDTLNAFVISPSIPVLLTCAGIYLNIKMKFFPLTKLKSIAGALFSKSGNNGVSPFSALTVALAGTLGVGNIIGVAAAITVGGAGAVFWMWIAAFLAMIVKYAEIVLAMKHRVIRDGKPRGGLMYCMKSRTASAVFAALCLASSFTVGNILQSNAAAEAFNVAFGIPEYTVGIIIALLTLLIISRGIDSIARFCSVTIPFLCVLFIIMSSYIIIRNIIEIPSLIAEIVRDAFGVRQVAGGIGGSVTALAIRVGFARGLITNEAGCGTAPIAHASSCTESPVKQGFLGIFEVFTDTVVLCSLTAFVILLSRDSFPTLEGMSLVISSYEVYFGRYAGILLALSLFLFALSTLVGWSYYGCEALAFFTSSKVAQRIYTAAFILCAFLGSITAPHIMWALSDATCGLMTLQNTTVLLFRADEISTETEKYFAREQYARQN